MKQFSIRLLNTIFGTIVISFGVVICINANIGYAPWEVFHVGLANSTGMSIGTSAIVAGLVILAIVMILGEKFGIGTVFCIILTGVFLDTIFIIGIIPVAKNLFVGIVMMLAGVAIIAVGSYFYMKSAFGAGPRDNLMVVLARKTKLPIGVCRCIVEVTVTAVGWLLGGMIGIGTVISALAIGPCIQIAFKVFNFDATAVKHETIAETFSYLFGKKSR